VSPPSPTTIVEEAVSLIIGSAGEGSVRARRLSTAQRNEIFRCGVGHGAGHGAGATTVVAKLYLRDSDPFFDSRFRREEKLLNLLAAHCPDCAPNVFGGCLVAGRYAVLVMEDLGSTSLESRLEAAGAAQQIDDLKRAIATMSRLHRTLDAFRPLYYRTVRSVELDRVTIGTLGKRFDIAIERIRGLEGRNGSIQPAVAAARAEFQLRVVRPLLSAPKRLIHNSLSPAHIMLGGVDRVIDFETMSIGPRALDVAELLEGYPVRLEDSRRVELIGAYHQGMPVSSGEDEFMAIYLCAALARSIDYAGVTAKRLGGERTTATQRARMSLKHLHYLRRAISAATALGAEAVLGWLDATAIPMGAENST